ncbi:MAG: helix-turn-helix transcriptional regulator, partial [Thermoflexales bacterium]|nr:helix-turn-helix transcriptional regulator [Thermoflexales bacterium]
MPDSAAASPESSRLQQIGARVRAAREATGYAPAQCARKAGLSLKRLLDCEAGQAALSLPELEALALVLGCSVQVLLGTRELRLSAHDVPADMLRQWTHLRARIIGARLKQARLSRGETLKAVAAAIGITAAALNRYEIGQPTPLPTLERLLQHYGLPLDAALDMGVGVIGEMQLRRAQHEQFDALDGELRAFICSPGAEPFLRIAQRLSRLSVEDLRTISEAFSKLAATEGNT